MSSETTQENAKTPPARPRRRAVLVLGPLLGIAVCAGVWLWAHHSIYISTDDAFVEAPVHVVSARVAGHVRQVHVEDNQPVVAGSLLVELDAEEYATVVRKAEAQLELARNESGGEQAGVGAARAALATTEAELAQARLDLERGRALFAREVMPRERLDRLETAQRAMTARREQALETLRRAEASAGIDRDRGRDARVALRAAELDQARLNLGYANVIAPVDGVVTRKAVEIGNNVRPGQSLLALVERGRPWVVANFKETQLTHLRPGQAVRLRVDAFPDQLFSGHVESIMAGTGSAFSLLPPENATGNYVKVVQRVPVRIVFDDPQQAAELLRVGMSVVPTVDTGRSFWDILAGLLSFR